MVHQLKIGQCSARSDLAAVAICVITDTVDITMALEGEIIHNIMFQRTY